MKHFNFFLILLLLISISVNAQSKGKIYGKITSKKEVIPNVFVYVDGGTQGTSSDFNGDYELEIPAEKEITIVVSSQGFRKIVKRLKLEQDENREVSFKLIEDLLGLDEVVVSATRNRVERRNTPVVVSTIKPRLLQATQSVSLADGLNFAPGVRVENNCQNCGFTQVRLNGLEGAYTQVLLNSRPVFTSLIGVYGLEQIPTNIIEKVEVVRSGGSALFGSNAIAGTVNVITKDPILNRWEIGSNFALVNGESADRVLNFNNSIVANDLKSGVTLFGSYRNRESLDVDGDGFTEMVALVNNTIGAKAFFKPNNRNRIGINLNAIREYRRGGDQLDLAPHFTNITEELDHDTFIGGLDYELNSKDFTNRLQVYSSISNTDRKSFYGGLGGSTLKQDSIIASNSYGSTQDLAWVNGVQFTKNFTKDVVTVGAEINTTSTEDNIAAYNRIIDQSTTTIGTYLQYEWKPSSKFTTLLGARLDNVLVDGFYTLGDIERTIDINETVFSPRITISYLFTEDLKFRGGYARGFRAPQAFNEDLHIASVGGEPQFVILSENLNSEFSNAYTASFNYSKTKNLLQADILLEGFYTTLQNPFTQISTGNTLANGSIIEEVRNGEGAKVYGANFEIGISPNTQWQFQLGGTFQKNEYKNPQTIFESTGVIGETDIVISEFVRTPDVYGFLGATYIPNKKFNVDFTGTYTGGMTVPLVISDTGFLQLNEVPSFFDLNIKIEHHFDISDEFMITFSGGVKNIFNSYQDDFDTGPTRDSNYIYGPGTPRTYFIGLKFGRLH
jgi:outer membrane receptor for ferrienterochelin and colicins